MSKLCVCYGAGLTGVACVPTCKTCPNMAHTVVVSIGRDVYARPMYVGMWEAYIDAVERALNDAGCSMLAQPKGSSYDTGHHGQWEGQSEDCAIFIAHVSATTLPWLAEALRKLAADFDQEAIGFITVPGTDHVVRAKP